MKHHSLPMVLLMLGLCMFCRTVVSDSAVISPDTIVGEWHATEIHPQRGNIDTTFVINADATFSGSLSINSEPAWQYSGVWRLEGNRITWEYLKSSLVLLQEDKAETDEILSVTETVLTYRSVRRGTENTLYRVK